MYSKYNQPKGFYVYAYLRKDGTPYYIGKGKQGRAWAKHHVIRNGHFAGVPVPTETYRIVIIESALTEVGSFALERRLIGWYGRKDNNTGILRNRTDGGEGGSGVVVTEEGRRLRSERNKGQGQGRKLSEDTIAKLRARKGTYSEETKRKISISNKGKIVTDETRQKIKKALKGKPNLGNKGRVRPPEQIAQRTHSRQTNGRPWFTEEHKKKISDAVKRSAAEKRAKKLTHNDEHISTLFKFE